METLLMLALMLLAIFLILLVLVQRGRGGGLAGALGGPGGSSAFGAKAGDAFTKFTIYAASVWILLCVVAAYWSKNELTDKLGDGQGNITASVEGTADIVGTATDEEGDAAAADPATESTEAEGEPESE